MSRRDRPGARSLHCRGYDIHRIGEKDLRSAFSEYGKVVDVYLPKDYHTKQLRGFAYIQFDSEAEADSARQKLDRTDVFQDNHHVNIMWATGERKTPTDMRRLDIERDNPHARDREPGSDRPSWPGPDDYGRRREGGRGGGRGGGGGGRDRYNDRASRGGYDDRGSRGYDDRGPPREHRDRDRDRDYDRDRDGGRDGGRARDRYRDHARDRDRDYDRDYDRDARGSRDDRDFEPDDRRRDRDRDRDDGGNGGGGGSGGGGGGGGGGSRYGFGGHSRRRSPSPRRDYDRDRDYDRGDGPDRDSRKRGRDASPRRSSRDDPDARRPYSRSRSRSRSPTRRRTDDASFDQPRPKDSGDRDDADRKWDKPAANSSFPGSSTNAEAAGFGHGSENRPGAEANGRESRDAGLENDISGKGPAEDDAQRRARSSTGLKLRSAPLSPVETTPESR